MGQRPAPGRAGEMRSDAAHVSGMDSLHDRTLKLAVELATGNPNAAPRPVQSELSARIAAAMDETGQVVVEATTGAGKSISYLVPAALRAVLAGERTVVSTESLSLQAQVVEKDLPVVTQAVLQTTGELVSFAILKGWSNFACSLDAVASLRTASGLDPEAQIPMSPAGLLELVAKAEAAMASVPAGTRVSGKDGALVDAHGLAQAAVWAVHATSAQSMGDRHSYPDSVAGPVWDAISVSASDCLKDSCPLRELCLPARAKKKAAAAQIVVTNHTLLGVQAAKSVPAVMSSRSLGQFHHVVVDEAHGLPGVVRAQGATAISGRRIGRLRISLARAVEDWSKATNTYLKNVAKASGTSAVAETAGKRAAEGDQRKKTLLERVNVGFTVAGDVDRSLGVWRARADRSGVVKLGENGNPLNDSAALVNTWLADMRKMLKELTPVGYDLSVVRAQARLKGLMDSLADGVKMVSEHTVGTARWIERIGGDDDSLEAKATPVDIAGSLRANVWTTEVIADEVDVDSASLDQLTADLTNPDDPAVQKIPVSVTCVSATLPRGFTRDAGMATKLTRFPSPLAEAYTGSVLHIPRPSPADVIALSAPYETSKTKFHTPGHAEWSLPRITALVAANGGSSLVLAATAAAGRDYTAALRESAAGRWQVLSQWDGRLASAVASDWRDDHASVLVGTRSYMSGLDAPGATCTLVVLDRPPRAASNPVDDARVELMAASAQLSKWDADRRVYVADAAVLLAQAIGRLLRSTSDRGMVVVLDPRLLKNNPFSYPEQTRQSYMSTVSAFGLKVSDPAVALEWLRMSALSRGRAA